MEAQNRVKLNSNSSDSEEGGNEDFDEEENSEEEEIKIDPLQDMGMTKPGLRYKMFSPRVGTPIYRAPEMLTRDYSENIDNWSCGCIIYFMLVGKHPFADNL